MTLKITLLILTICLVLSCQNSSKNESTLPNLKYGNASITNNYNSYDSNSTEKGNIENNVSQKSQDKNESVTKNTDNSPKSKSNESTNVGNDFSDTNGLCGGQKKRVNR